MTVFKPYQGYTEARNNEGTVARSQREGLRGAVPSHSGEELPEAAGEHVGAGGGVIDPSNPKPK